MRPSWTVHPPPNRRSCWWRSGSAAFVAEADDLFRFESLLNTPLFVGFDGFVSKLWLAHDVRGTYRGVYEWDGAHLAETYARALWRVLALVSARGSIRYHVIPAMHRDQLLQDPPTVSAERREDWWQLTKGHSALRRTS